MELRANYSWGTAAQALWILKEGYSSSNGESPTFWKIAFDMLLVLDTERIFYHGLSSYHESGLSRMSWLLRHPSHNKIRWAQQ